MTTNSNGGTSLAALLDQYKRASSATTADRTTRDQLLDDLQEAVGLSGKMATETEIIRRAEKLIQSR